MSRRTRWASAVLLVATVGVGVGHSLLPRSAINAANAGRIEEGMTLEHVEGLLGGPERDESTGPLTFDRTGDGTHRIIDVLAKEVKTWSSDTAVIHVYFDGFGEDARVQRCRCVAVRRMHESPLARLRRWLHLR